MDNESKRLIELNFEEARKRKWEEGRAAHGPYMEKDPLDELSAELLDGFNYCRILAGDGRLTPEERSYMVAISNSMKSYFGYIQRVHLRDPKRVYTATEYPFS